VISGICHHRSFSKTGSLHAFFSLSLGQFNSKVTKITPQQPVFTITISSCLSEAWILMLSNLSMLF